MMKHNENIEKLYGWSSDAIADELKWLVENGTTNFNIQISSTRRRLVVFKKSKSLKK